MSSTYTTSAFVLHVLFSIGLLSFVVGVNNGESLKIAAFNVQVFGHTKMSKTEVVKVLVDIISNFDVILIQEIRDSTGEAIVELLDQVNAANQGKEFSMTTSPRLGRTSSKEQYAYLYRSSSGLSVTQEYVYDDGDEAAGNDTFEREPYVVVFKSSRTKVSKIAMIGIHVAPNEAVEEMQAFGDVFDDVRQKTSVNEIVLMGDLNAGCSYVPNYKWAQIPMKSDSNYWWLISDSIDTTVSNTDCAYDRFIMIGNGLKESYINGSAQVFRYDTEYGLNQSTALDVSDHYPIVFNLELTDSGAAHITLNVIYTCIVVFAAITCFRL